MYNDIVEIIFCIFAVFGVYALIREIIYCFFSGKNIIVAARIDDDMDEERIFDAVTRAEWMAERNRHTERRPVLLCHNCRADELSKYGYKIYMEKDENGQTLCQNQEKKI